MAEAERISASVFAGKPATFLRRVFKKKVTLVVTWYGQDRARVVPVEKSSKSERKGKQ